MNPWMEAFKQRKNQSAVSCNKYLVKPFDIDFLNCSIHIPSKPGSLMVEVMVHNNTCLFGLKEVREPKTEIVFELKFSTGCLS
jgi:hypothetical protein